MVDVEKRKKVKPYQSNEFCSRHPKTLSNPKAQLSPSQTQIIQVTPPSISNTTKKANICKAKKPKQINLVVEACVTDTDRATMRGDATWKAQIGIYSPIFLTCYFLETPNRLALIEPRIYSLIQRKAAF
ncbi:hypothetical protein Tsubulata_023467 [Turnera subulata]|uniref:Uncharacterized protein n=1 Tax=Turnera subulata TaxID=218843 RepID=A0A9Q0FQT1_9ROSI|nr:hypothetical protein Tsubulata_023467 [Turnera subulata]